MPDRGSWGFFFGLGHLARTTVADALAYESLSRRSFTGTDAGELQLMERVVMHEHVH